MKTITVVGNGDITSAELARRAARVMETHGFSSGEFEDSRGHVCILGAMGMVVSKSPQNGERFHSGMSNNPVALEIAKAMGHQSVQDMVTWNNYTNYEAGVRREDGEAVIEALQNAATRLESQRA